MNAIDAEKAARKSLRKLSQIETTNKLLALQVPTMGSELRERALARETAGQLEALQEGGAATVIGGAGRLTQAVGEQAAQEAARIDALQAQRDRLVLGQEQQIESAQKDVLRNIQGMRLQGAQAAAQDGRARQQAGAQNIASGIALGAQTFASGLNPYGGEGGEKTTDLGEQVDIRGSVQDFQKMSGGQPQFQSMYFDSMGRPYNPAYQTPAFGSLSGGMTTPTSLPSNFNYSALGTLAG